MLLTRSDCQDDIALAVCIVVILSLTVLVVFFKVRIERAMVLVNIDVSFDPKLFFLKWFHQKMKTFGMNRGNILIQGSRSS